MVLCVRLSHDSVALSRSIARAPGNLPVAALIPLTILWFGIDEAQKVMFIFIACVAFVISDTTLSIRDVDQRYIDTAYTLGAGRWQVILKVLIPLAMPNVFNSLRLLFGRKTESGRWKAEGGRLKAKQSSFLPPSPFPFPP